MPQTNAAALVVALNNMLVYGELQSGKHMVMVIDEHNAEPGEITMLLLDAVDDDEVTDYNPVRNTANNVSVRSL